MIQMKATIPKMLFFPISVSKAGLLSNATTLKLTMTTMLIFAHVNLAAAQMPAFAEHFDRADRNNDGKITADKLPRRQLFRRLDRNGDGVIDRTEIPGGTEFGDAKDERVTGKAKALLSEILSRENPSSAQAGTRFRWESSLLFDPAEEREDPLPVNAMNLVAHKGMLFCGLTTSCSAISTHATRCTASLTPPVILKRLRFPGKVTSSTPAVTTGRISRDQLKDSLRDLPKFW